MSLWGHFPSSYVVLRRGSLPVVPIVAIALAGCAQDLVRSEALDTKTSIQAGLVYSLPKGQVQLVAQRKKITDDDVEKARSAATEAATLVKVTAAALQSAKESLEKRRGELKHAQGSAVPDLQKLVALDEASVAYLTTLLESRKRLSSATKATADELARAVGQFEESASITTLPVVPDRNHRYIADLNHSIWRNDKFKLTTNNGLLATTAVTSADETKSILASLAGIAGILTGPKIPGVKLSRGPSKPDSTCEPYSTSVIFDPTNAEETRAAMRSLYSQKASILLDVDGIKCSAGPTNLCRTNETTDQTSPVTPALNAGQKPPGLAYRAPRNVTISLIPGPASESCVLASPPPAQAFSTVLPDSTASFVLPAKGGAFTTAVVGHSFKDGMPTEYSRDQPSELVGVASIPIEVLKAFVSVPTELIKLRVDYDSQANAALEAKVKEQETRLLLLKAQRELDAANTSTTTPIE